MHIGAYLLVLFVCLFVLLVSSKEMYVQFIKVQIMAIYWWSFLYATIFGAPCWPEGRMQVFSSSTFASFFCLFMYSHWCQRSQIGDDHSFHWNHKKKLNEEKVGVSLAVESPPVKSFREGTVLSSNTEHYFIHLVLRVVCVLHVFRRSHGPHLITGRDVVVLDEAVIILLVHRRLLSVAPGTLLRGKLNLKAWEANIKKGLLENVNKSQRAKDNWLPILHV